MTQFKYDTLADMGDLAEFAEKLGTWPSGEFPRFSGTRTENSTWDAMLAADKRRYPERWAEEAVTHPTPPLRDGLQGIIIRLWYDVRRFIAIWTDREVLQRYAREHLKRLWPKLNMQLNKQYRQLLTKLGEPKNHLRYGSYTVRKGDTLHDIVASSETLVNKPLADSLDRAVAEEKTLHVRKVRPDDPRNDSSLYD